MGRLENQRAKVKIRVSAEKRNTEDQHKGACRLTVALTAALPKRCSCAHNMPSIFYLFTYWNLKTWGDLSYTFHMWLKKLKHRTINTGQQTGKWQSLGLNRDLLFAPQASLWAFTAVPTTQPVFLTHGEASLDPSYLNSSWRQFSSNEKWHWKTLSFWKDAVPESKSHSHQDLKLSEFLSLFFQLYRDIIDT